MPATVLLVDDEKNILLTLKQALLLEGYDVELASSGQVALEVLAAKPVDAVLMDVKMPDMDGITALEKMAVSHPRLPVIMMSGHGTIDTAVKATRMGARDFLEKPIGRERLLVALRNALQHQRVMEELAELRQEVGQFEMVGTSQAMARIYELIRRIAPSEGRVLITGENGSGKELVARAVHQHSRRKSGPFVKLNCAAVPHELIESELFGHERGAFTGAVAARRGKFELAHEGTLFLDEIGDMPQAMQAKLLRVLQEGELERVGAADTIKVDVRVIAATNKDLEKEIADGRFREDLYYRINVVQVHVPPLRERKEDLPDLIHSFLKESCSRNGKRPMTLSHDALHVMASYDYPGNVRELRNLVERLAILCEGPVISGAEADMLLPRGRARSTPVPSLATTNAAVAVPPVPASSSSGVGVGPSSPSLPSMGAVTPPAIPMPGQANTGAVPMVAESAPSLVGANGAGSLVPFKTVPGASANFRITPDRPFRDQVEDAEREIILHTLAFTRDNVTEAARLLDLERGHFYKKMKALGIKRGGDHKETA